MDWNRDLPDWPLSHLSRRIDCRPHQWHVQESGQGETLLLLHGAGASTHTWRDLFPILSEQYRTIAIDLPGQGFTRMGSRGRSSLPLMSQDIIALCAQESWQPKAIIGHSAGAAIALYIADAMTEPLAVMGINAALGRFEGIASWLFPLLAKALALNPFTSHAFVLGTGHEQRARRLIKGTGSDLSDEGFALYGRLFADRTHVDGTLQMMSQWNTDTLNNRFETLSTSCLLVAGERDKAVAPRISKDASALIKNAEFQLLQGLGHLAHEENPEKLCAIALSWLNRL